MTILLKKDAQQFIERNSGSCRQLLGWSWLEIWKYKPPLVTTQSCPAQNLYPLIKIFQYLIDLGNWSLHISRTLISIDLVMGRPRLPMPPSPFRRPRRSELSANNKQLVNFKKMYRIYQFSSYAVKISFAAFYIQQFDWLLLTAFENFQTTPQNTRKLYKTLFPLSICTEQYGLVRWRPTSPLYESSGLESVEGWIAGAVCKMSSNCWCTCVSSGLT